MTAYIRMESFLRLIDGGSGTWRVSLVLVEDFTKVARPSVKLMLLTLMLLTLRLVTSETLPAEK